MICAKTGLRIQLVAASYVLMLLAACSSSKPVATEWIIVRGDTTATGHGFIIYAAPSTIRQAGTRVRMWSMIDSTAIEGAALDRPHFSWQDEWEYDCEYKSSRPVQFREYAGKMGTGENKFSYTAPAVGGNIGMTPGSVGESLWKMACGKE
jgi:hypothetical protein